MNQLLVVVLLINLGVILFKLGPLGFFLTLILAGAAYYSLGSVQYLKKTWPVKIAFLIVLCIGLFTVHRVFNLMPLTIGIGIIQFTAFFIFSNIQKF